MLVPNCTMSHMGHLLVCHYVTKDCGKWGFVGYGTSRVTTCLENLEMSGNLKHVREMSGIMLTVREESGKNYCQGKLAQLGGGVK